MTYAQKSRDITSDQYSTGQSSPKFPLLARFKGREHRSPVLNMRSVKELWPCVQTTMRYVYV